MFSRKWDRNRRTMRMKTLALERLEDRLLLAAVSGVKWNDLDGDSAKDIGEPGLSGWTIFLDADSDGVLDGGETSTVTASDGSYSFAGLEAGSYDVAEVAQDGWAQVSPVGGVWSVELAAEEAATGVDFGNRLAADGTAFVVRTGEGVIYVQPDGSQRELLPGGGGYAVEAVGDIVYIGGKSGFAGYDLEGNEVSYASFDSAYRGLTFVAIGDGRFATLDNSDDEVHFLAADGTHLATVLIQPTPNSSLQNVDGVVVGNQLVVSEDGDSHILAIDLDTYEVSTLADLSAWPGWLGAIDYHDGTYYVCQSRRLLQFAPGGEVTEVSTLPAGSLTGIVVVDGYAYVTVNFADAVYRVDVDTGAYELFGGAFDYPADIEVVTAAADPAVDVELVVVTTPSGSDTAASLPTSLAAVPQNRQFYVEAWARNADGSASGITGGYVDMWFDSGDMELDGFTNSALYSVAPGGSIGSGGAWGLGGGIVGGATDMGDDEWVRLGYVTARGVDAGTAHISAAPGGPLFERAGSEEIPRHLVQINFPQVSVEVGDIEYVAQFVGPGGQTVSVLDMRGDLDVLADDVTVYWGAGAAVSSILIGGWASGPMGGLGLVVSGASNVGAVIDLRVEGEDVAFFAADCPVGFLSLSTGMTGSHLNERVIGGLDFPDNIDNDNTRSDQSAIYTSGRLGAAIIGGGLGGDVAVTGANAYGSALGFLMTRGGGLAGDLTLSGDGSFVMLGGDLSGDVSTTGGLAAVIVSGGIADSTFDVAERFGFLSVTGAWQNSSLDANALGFVSVRGGVSATRAGVYDIHAATGTFVMLSELNVLLLGYAAPVGTSDTLLSNVRVWVG